MTSTKGARVFAAILLFQATALFSPVLASAQTAASAALTGLVSSQEEGPMEGVLVSAKKSGSTIRVTVASDRQGRYSFPRNRLEPGEYSLGIRAVGYEIDPAKVEVTAQKAATADLKLRKTQDLAAQLTNTEWLMSMPANDLKNSNAVLECTRCHTLERIVRSKHTADEFIQVIQRMSGYCTCSLPGASQPAVRDAEAGGQNPERFRRPAEFLSSVNLSKASKWEYPLKTLPRPTGRATRVIITEYDLPRKMSQPHDAIFGSDGMAWYAEYGDPINGMFFGKLNPKTGQATEYSIPVMKPGMPLHGQEISEDPDGNMWAAMVFQAGIAKFDKKTQKVQSYPLPKELAGEDSQLSMLDAAHANVDGKLWVKDQRIRTGAPVLQFEIATGKYTPSKPLPERIGVYGISSDTQNNVYLMSIGDNHIGKVDAKTLESKLYRTPTPDSGPRRGHADSQDRLWFAEYRGNKVGMFDPRTEKIQEWAMPTAWTNPYDAVLDKNGELWTAGMNSDRVVRLDPKTGAVTEYMLPQTTNVRRVFVDNSTTPVTFWVGNNQRASLVKVEPLD